MRYVDHCFVSCRGFGALLRQLQGGTPIVGLLSKLFSPTGLGTEDIVGPEIMNATSLQRGKHAHSKQLTFGIGEVHSLKIHGVIKVVCWTELSRILPGHL